MSFKRRRISYELGPAAGPRNARWDARKETAEALLDGGLPYSRKLCGHTECVNALVLSRSGRWLASGGDDPHILLWDFHQGDLKEPSKRFLGHRDSVLDLSCHPQQDEIFLSASDDGCTILHDMRAASTLTRAQGTLQHDAEMTCVQFHPEMEHIFVTGDIRGELCLRDTRMAFGPKSRRLNKGVVRKFVTTITKPTMRHLSNPELSSVTFDSTGTKLAATMALFGPTIYKTSDPYPIAVCAATTLPDGSPIPEGERTYANSCTIKHGSFGGGGLLDDPYYCAGSDDFRAYMWKLPPLAELALRRREVSMDDWSNEDPNTVAFAESKSGPRHIPITLSRPTARLAGHRSIVNTALMHPTFPAILTAGIERNILLHSPTPATPFMPSSSLSVTPAEVRTLPAEETPESRLLASRARGTTLTIWDDEPEDDSMSIALFDQILRQESGADVFETRRWSVEEDDDEDEDEDEAEDRDETEDEDDEDEDMYETMAYVDAT
ncbi:hypothetical protein FOMPIDRAFT_1032367 [Fomitopsis schrenkii]|uniref:Uncharacterized protein n=1 Tax=Fomitopsis schrenkii TaxID=2126942 RepID=S8DTI4_FOMSC|nr:hypothetical protein FOMPIDRAFT_1032367 [Fomitopsis schrenkii]